MRFILLICLFLPVVSFGQSQSIVINGSFNNVNICDEYHAKCAPSGWFYITDGPKGFLGNDGFISMLSANYLLEQRQYWQTKLLCKTIIGEKYKISLKVSAPAIGPNLNDIGLFFTDTFLHATSDTLLQPQEYINFSDATYRNGRNGWFEIEKEFVATNAHQYLVIGNFSKQSNRDITAKRKTRNVYISVDDISLSPVNLNSCIETSDVKQELYSITKRHGNKPEEKKIEEKVAAIDTPKTSITIDTVIINNIQFAFDSNKLIDTSELKKLSIIFDRSPIQKIQVAGFTDDIGSEQYNLELSKRRAVEVSTVIKKLYNTPDSQIEAEGRGISTRFKNRVLNRRVEIYLYHEK